MSTKRVIKVEIEVEIEEPRFENGEQVSPEFFNVEKVTIDGEISERQFPKIWVIKDNGSGHSLIIDEGDY